LELAALAQPGFERAFDLFRAGDLAEHCCNERRADGTLVLSYIHVLRVRFHQAPATQQGLNGPAVKGHLAHFKDANTPLR
jgi:hypothetical protein